MKIPLLSISTSIAALVSLQCPQVASAEPPKPLPAKQASSGKSSKSPKKEETKPKYPEGDTVPGGRTRGEDSIGPAISVFAPNREGLTTQPQPTLYWYQSGPAIMELQICERKSDDATPLFEVRLPKQTAGIHSINLAERGVALKENVGYRWSVQLQASGETLMGFIKRVPPAETAKRIEKASTLEQQAKIYKMDGFWYDALKAISLAIAQEPDNAAFHTMRADLLRQEKLKDAAAVAERGGKPEDGNQKPSKTEKKKKTN